VFREEKESWKGKWLSSSDGETKGRLHADE
jgi:hypothetical protein